MVQVSACVGSHKSVKRIGVDLLMGGSPSHESGSRGMIGLATSKE